MDQKVIKKDSKKNLCVPHYIFEETSNRQISRQLEVWELFLHVVARVAIIS